MQPFMGAKTFTAMQNIPQIPPIDRANKLPIPGFLTTEEVANLFRVSTVSIWWWDRKGKLKPCRIGQRKLYRVTDIENLIEKKTYVK